MKQCIKILLAGCLLFLLQGMALAAPQEKGLSGTINGKTGIHMNLNVNGSTLSGFYYLDDVRTTISLSGTLDKENHVTLKEFDSQGNWVGTFKGEWTAKGFAGTWTSQDGTKKTPFALTFSTMEEVIAGRYLFTGAGTEGVFIYDGELRLQYHIPTDSRVVQLRKDSNYLYILEDSNHIQIYDIKNPKSPVAVCDYFELADELPFTDFFLEKQRLVLFNPYTGLTFLDVRDQRQPSILGTYRIDHRTPNFTYANGKGYFYDEVRFYAVNFADLHHPVVLYETEHHHMDEMLEAGEDPEDNEMPAKILVNGSRVYVLGRRLTVYDFSRNPVQVTRSEIEPHAKQAVIYGKYLYLITPESKLCIYELENFTTVKLIRELYSMPIFNADAQGLFIQDKKYLYITNGRYGITLLNVENPERLLPVAKSPDGKFAQRVFAYKDQVILQTNDEDLAIIDSANYKMAATFIGSSRRFLPSSQSYEIPAPLLVNDNFYTFGEMPGLFIYSLPDGKFMYMESLPGYISYVNLHDESLYMTYTVTHEKDSYDIILEARALANLGQNKETQSRKYNLTDYISPADRKQVLNGTWLYTVYSFFFKEQYLYLQYAFLRQDKDGTMALAKTSLVIIDLSDQEHPVKIADSNALILFPTWISQDFAVSGYGEIFDFHNPLAPRRVSWLYKPENVEELIRLNDLEMIGTLAYLSVGEYGWGIFDLSDPVHPVLLRVIHIDGGVNDIAIIGNKAFVAAGNNGYLVYDITNPKEPQLIHNEAYPNLFQVIGY